MKWNQLTWIVLVVGCAFLSQSGCEEQTAVEPRFDSEFMMRRPMIGPVRPARAQAAPRANIPAPRIAFEKVTHDFGKIGPGTSNLCEFKFTNTGSGVLKIADVTRTCGCTPFLLAKKEYAPGESGILQVGYYSDKEVGATTKHLFVHSNDDTRPEVPLAIKATIVTKVDYEPKKLDLSLRAENGGCPKITLTSLDNQPFSITAFKSTAACITADYNPLAKATRFVLQPKVNMERLKSALHGRIEIDLSHPECNKLTILISTLPNFKISPPLLIVRGAKPQQPIVRKVRILSNYNEDFELESALSKKDIIKVLSYEKINNGYELELEVIPPAAADKGRVFTEAFFVKVKDGEKLEIPCSGFYSSKAAAPKTPTEVKEECATCGGKLVKFELVQRKGS